MERALSPAVWPRAVTVPPCALESDAGSLARRHGDAWVSVSSHVIRPKIVLRNTAGPGDGQRLTLGLALKEGCVVAVTF